MMTSQLVKVRREKLAACMTCPICHKLLNDATTISECLHTFCRKCIYEKITVDELDCCPVCNTDLGCLPLEKLRADHNLQDLRAKIFPSEGTKAKAPEVVPSLPLPARRKERSLSSLVVNTPRVSAQTGLIGRRTKSAVRKVAAPRESTFCIEEPSKKAENHPESSKSPEPLSKPNKKVEDRPECSRSPETLSKIALNRRPVKEDKNSSPAELYKQHMPDKGKEEIAEPLEIKADLWKPLNCLVEAASKSKFCKSDLQGFAAQSTPSHDHDNEDPVPTAKVKRRRRKAKVHDDENGSTPVPSGSVKPRKLRGVREKRAAASEVLNIPAQAVIDSSCTYERGINPIWFSLVASNNQEGGAPLPQIPSCYLRIKDGNVPVSFLKKYIAKKLNLTSEAEVEIALRGQPLVPTLQLYDLVDLWLQTTPTSERVEAMVGSSAKDFMMVLSYGRKSRFPLKKF